MKTQKALLIGNLTIDHNRIRDKKYAGPGGPVYFAAKTFENLGVQPIILSPWGEDFPKKYLAGTIIYPQKPNLEKTLIFQNIYPARASRKQQVVEHKKSGLNNITKYLHEMPKAFDILMVAPILHNIDKQTIFKLHNRFRKSLQILLPQGFFRKIRKGGIIEPQDWRDAFEIIKLFDIVVVSDEDWVDLDICAQRWSRVGNIIIVTKEDKGCTLYEKGFRKDIAGFPLSECLDATGAGDIFAAGFSFAYSQSQNSVKSAIFANAIARVTLRERPNQLKYNYSGIIKFIKSKYRRYQL